MIPPVTEPVPPLPPQPVLPSVPPNGFSAQLRLLVGLACIVIIIAGMRAAASVINNVLLALLVAQTMAPLMEWLRGRGFKAWVAVTVTILVVLVFLAGVSTILGTSVASLTGNLPQYEAGLQDLRDRILAQAARWGFDPAVVSGDLVSPGRAMQLATALLSWLANAFGDGFLIFFLASIMLANFADRETHPDREKPTDVVMERLSVITVDVRPYLRITAATGLVFSIIITLVLALLGVPYAVVWGVLAFFLNFLPQVGIILSWIPPALIALVADGWQKAVGVVVAYTVINFVTDNIVKPRVMSQGLNISFLAIMLSLLFWGWVLGPAGAILSVPLTLAVRRFVAQFHEPSMLPPVRPVTS